MQKAGDVTAPALPIIGSEPSEISLFYKVA
jgi:hypothetical protein